MTNERKIFILLADGVGLKNFAYSNFFDLGEEAGFKCVFWNNTPFNLDILNFDSINIQNSKSHLFSDIYKNAQKEIELDLFKKRTADPVYDSYRFPTNYKSLKNSSKNLFTKSISKFCSSEEGLRSVIATIEKLERGTDYYKECLITLKKENPALVFCTNQRPLTAIAAILAAKDLKIPTACFIFSWDNLPKATLVVQSDYYFVWSALMKIELLFYYPNISSDQIIITGTPQFENHFNQNGIVTRDVFFAEHNLDRNKKYICYSGDDVTTCPDDPQYLADVAQAVEELNKNGKSLGIIFRKCPVDFSDRFDEVLDKYKNIIVAINPLWEKIGEAWNTILPKPEDAVLQLNTIAHTEMVINLGSSMIFDYAAHNKPCAFINYDVQDKVLDTWSVSKIYKYVHFRSMPTDDAVIWLNSKEEIADKILIGLESSSTNVGQARKWFEIIAGDSPDKSSLNIWAAINKILG